MEEELEHIGVVKDDCNGFPWKRIGYVCETDLAVLPIGAKVYGPDVVEALRTQIAELTRTNLEQAAQIELLQSDIAHIKEVEFVRRVEKVAANWQLKLETQTIKSREQFEKLLRFMDDYCEISDSDFTEIESTVEEVLLSSTTPSQALADFTAKVRNEAIEQAAVASWVHYMDTCKRLKMHPSEHGEWLCTEAIRNLKELP